MNEVKILELIDKMLDSNQVEKAYGLLSIYISGKAKDSESFCSIVKCLLVCLTIIICVALTLWRVF